jgi:hypothetical protein
MLILGQHSNTTCQWSNSCKPSKPQIKVLTNAKGGFVKRQVEWLKNQDVSER